jgi:putative ABC transport system permease protein
MLQGLSDTLREIFHYLRQYKARTFMTMFGIVWGTVSIVVLLAFGVGLRKSMSKNMHGMGEAVVIMFPGRTSMPFAGFGRDRYIRFRAEDAELLRQQITLIANVSPEYSKWDAAVRVGDKVNKPNVTGVIPEYGAMRNILYEPDGRWLDDLDMKDRKRVVFLGDNLKKFLFGEGVSAVGKYVYIADSPFLVVGVLGKKTQSSSYNARDTDRAFIPATTFAAFFGDRYVNNLIYRVADPRTSKQAQEQVFQVLGKKNKFNPEDKQAINIWDTTEMDKFVYYFTLGFNLFMGIIGVMTLTVGGIGLANIMYVVVQERTGEIGIRRSAGAKRKNILGQFIVEAFIIVSFAALIGFALSWLIIKGISLLPIEEYVGIPEMNVAVALITIFILGLTGFIAGFFPARKAALLNVIDCLRY